MQRLASSNDSVDLHLVDEALECVVENPPESPDWLDGLVQRVEAHRMGTTAVDEEMALKCAVLLARLLDVPDPVAYGDGGIDWPSWAAFRAWYDVIRPALRYSPSQRAYFH